MRMQSLERKWKELTTPCNIPIESIRLGFLHITVPKYSQNSTLGNAHYFVIKNSHGCLVSGA